MDSITKRERPEEMENEDADEMENAKITKALDVPNIQVMRELARLDELEGMLEHDVDDSEKYKDYIITSCVVEEVPKTAMK